MRSAKLLTTAGVLAASALALAACAQPAPEATPQDVDLRMTVWTANEDQLALFDSIAEEYMADHPEVASVTFDPLPFEDYTTTVTTQIAGGNAPDLAWVLENAAPDFVASGALLPLNETLEGTEGYDFGDISESAAALWVNEDGDLVGYPFSTSPFVMFANNDLLAAAGQPTAAELAASGDWNWEGVSAAGAAVNTATGKTGFVIRDFDYVTWENLASVWLGWGAAPWSEDGTTCEFDSPEMVEAFEFLHDAAFTSKSMNGPGTTADFFAGEAGFTVTQISRAGLLAEAGFAFDLLPLPEGPAGEYSMVGQAAVGVLSQGENPQVAADFLAYFTNAENTAALAQYFPPPRESLLNAETLAAANPVLSEQQLEDVVVPAIANGVVRPGHSNGAEIGQQVRSALDAIWTENADIEAVLGDVCGALDPMLAD